MLNDRRRKAVAAVGDFSHRASLAPASPPSYPVTLTKARSRISLRCPPVKMIAAPVVAPGEIDQLAADARRAGSARQLTQPSGHLPIMIAVYWRRRRFRHCQGSYAGEIGKPAGGANDNTPNTCIPARVVQVLVVFHTRPTSITLLPNAEDNYLENAQRPISQRR